MQSHDVLREVLQHTSAKQIAADLGLSLSLVYKWTEPPDGVTGSGSSNPLDRVDQLMKSTKDVRIVHWLCQQCGGFFIRNPQAQPGKPANLIPATNDILQEFADLLSVIASSAADNIISNQEAEKIRGRWEELKTVTETFVRCCEGGNFEAMRDARPVGKASAAVTGSIHKPASR